MEEMNVTEASTAEPPPFVMYSDAEKAAIAITWYIIAIPAYAIYFFFALVVYRNNKYHTAGYYLMVSLSITEWLTMSMYVITGLPQSLIYPHYILSRPTRDIIGSLKSFTYTAAVIHMFFICLNRYVSVVHFSHYRQIFTNSRVVAIIVICWVIAIITNIPFMTGDVAYYWEPMIFGHMFDFSRPGTPIYFRLHQAFAALILVSAAYFYTAVLIKIHSSKKVRVNAAVANAGGGGSGGGGSSVSSALKEEIMLTAQFAVVTAIFIAAWISITIQSEVDLSQLSLQDVKWLNAVNSCMWILNYAVNAFVYLGMNKRMRADVMHMIRGGKAGAAVPKGGTSVVVVSNSKA